jgi:hypothetical protein
MSLSSSGCMQNQIVCLSEEYGDEESRVLRQV